MVVVVVAAAVVVVIVVIVVVVVVVVVVAIVVVVVVVFQPLVEAKPPDVARSRALQALSKTESARSGHILPFVGCRQVG